VCARCHRNKTNLQPILCSGSELVRLFDRILLLVACRPRARVIRACAVGIARRGAQIGRLGVPCKAGGRRCSLTHDVICRSAPQFRAIGGPVGRTALRLETGRGHLPFANRAGCERERARFGRAWIVRAGWAGWMGRTCDARKEIACPSHLGGAGRAHVEGESLGRMFRAGRHARYVPWSPEERGPGSGAPHLAWGPLLGHRNRMEIG
jgi:hypothetical protein